MSLLRKAIKAQTDNSIAAITGRGIDNHLLALKKVIHGLREKRTIHCRFKVKLA